MATIKQIRRFRRRVIYIALTLLALFFFFLIFVDRFIEPILRDRLHTLIIRGSDSLYSYHLGKLRANFFGGNVEVENLQVKIDSNHYHRLKGKGRLPSLTMQLNLQKGHIKGVSLISLVFGKKIKIEEIMSKQADIKLSRHPVAKDVLEETDQPLWKSVQPDISSIAVKRIRLDGVKLLYRNADTSESVKLQFDECFALFEDIRIDSLASIDSTRIGFTKVISMRFHDLKYRTADSAYKMKAEWITYSSKDRTFEVDSFKLQPTLEKEDYYKAFNKQKSLYYVEFVKMRFRNFRLDRFIHKDIIDADSAVFTTPDISVYLDRTAMPDFESKIGNYPHQKLLSASSVIRVKHLSVSNAKFQYTERNAKNGQEGTVKLKDINLAANNITNDHELIKINPVCVANVQGLILNSSPMQVQFRFFLDSLNGRYDADGWVKNISAAQLNPLAVPLANVQINSFDISQLNFQVRGFDHEAWSNVQMPYRNLSLTIRKTDEETGVTKTSRFLTKFLNRFVIWPDNPGSDGQLRIATNSKVLRLTTQSFFGLLWKAIFSGMQDVMMKSGRYG